ncbi:helix-turn-helix domain-containing protein [Imperialibacter roseus]|uniref:Helix-turn-helix domain-containing protein n=1 Tax=Imperialibacter roseus TaxID=1324217 RepID=A0ABZ0IQB5_9BACT|nr:helix-turn-helix domain-containing protein [Imperialibacter roseus]WOK06560.1 helix-turn-helix domain-containing protein [Imperialibacter roseus]
MSASDILLVIISGLGVTHGLFMAVILWLYPKGNPLSNKLLSGLLIVLSFRVGKSVFLEFTTSTDIKIIFVGLSAIMAIGPLYYLFALSSTQKSFRLKAKHGVHFLPAVVGFIGGWQFEEHHAETLPMLLFISIFLAYYLHFLVYLLVTYRYILQQRKAGLNTDVFDLLRLLFYGLLAIWVVYVLNLLDEFIPYIIGPILYSIVAYVISFIVFRKGYIEQIDQTKYKTTPVTEEQREQIFKKVLKHIVHEKEYQNPGLTLKSLSTSLNLSPQIVSQVINLESGKNFNHFVNTYRIEEARHLLKLEHFKNQTIAAVAYEVGFNSISSFNTAFKKLTGKTPVTFRSEVSK